MLGNVFKEKLEGYQAELKTRWGLVSFLISNLIEGFIIVTYVEEIFNYILNIKPF